MRRWSVRATGAIVVLALLAVGVLRIRARALDAQLRARVEKVHSGLERLSHVANPIEGRAGDALWPVLVALTPVVKYLDSRLDPSCKRVASGKAPWASLAPSCQAALEKVRPHWPPLLASSHRKLAGGPDGFSIGLGYLAGRSQQPVLDGLNVDHVDPLAWLLALEVQARLQANEAERALTACVDGLAVARDLAHGTQYRLIHLGTRVQSWLLKPCAAALAAGDAASRQSALARLEAVRSGLAAFADLILNEASEEQIWLLARRIDEGWLAPFKNLERDYSALDRDRRAKQLAAVADEALVARASVMAVAAAADRARGLESVRRSDSLGRFSRELDRFANQRLELDVLIGAAAALVHRDREGKWPTSIGELRPRAVGEPVQFEVKGADLEVSAPLFSPAAEGKRAVLVVHPPH